MDETTVTTVKAAIAAAVATMTALWGWFGWLVIAWVLLMLADWLIGSAAAAKEGRWSSAKMREGAWHKGGMILVVCTAFDIKADLLVCIALVADWLIGTILGHIPAVSLPFEYSVLLAPLVIVWYIIGELGSLAEHAVTFGAPVPSWLRNILEIGKNAVDAAGESIAGESGQDSGEDTNKEN